MKIREKWTATVRLLLFAFLYVQHWPIASSWSTVDDAAGSFAAAAAAASSSMSEDVVNNFFAAYFEKPCCVLPTHVRHHKSEFLLLC